jgi:hypothetical protein
VSVDGPSAGEIQRHLHRCTLAFPWIILDVLSIVIDSGIFIRFIGILGLGGGLLDGGVILVLVKRLLRLSSITARNEIPLNQIEYIGTVKHGIVRPSELRITYHEPTEDRLSYRVLWMPHRWMDEAGELEVARDVFANAGIEVRPG